MKNTLDSSIVKLTNYRSVWGYIHKNKQATIPQIAKSIGLSLPTVTRAIDYGIAEGIINPDGVIGAERGRMAQVYKLNADYMHFLLIYLDSDVLSYRIHDFRSRTIGSGNIPICDEKVLSTLENLVMTSVAADPLIAMTAIAVSGVVCKGVVMDSAAFPSLNHIDVAKRLNEKFGLTVLIDNDRLRKFSFGFNRLEFTCDALIKYQAMTCGSTLPHILSFCKFDSPIWAGSGLVLLGDSFRQSSVICQGRSHKWCEASLTDDRGLPYL